MEKTTLDIITEPMIYGKDNMKEAYRINDHMDIETLGINTEKITI